MGDEGTGRESEEKAKALETTVLQIQKQYGDGAIMRLGEAGGMNVDVIPTGSLGLDIALGVGGIPRGRVTEIYGPEASGKTTLCQHIIAEAQRRGGIASFIDTEHVLDPSYAVRCGVNVDELYISQPDHGEQALEIAEALVHSRALYVIVIDSVAALIPRAELEGDMSEPHMALQARLMSKALRKLAGAIKRSNTAVIFTNQLRMKLGVMFGSPETTSGGRALKFYASIRLDIRRVQALKEGGTIIGNRTRVRVTKNKVAPPFRTTEFDIMYNEGISREGDLLDVGVELGLVDKRGAHFSLGETRLGQGRENAKATLRDSPEMAAELEAAILEAAGLPAPSPMPVVKEALESEPLLETA